MEQNNAFCLSLPITACIGVNKGCTVSILCIQQGGVISTKNDTFMGRRALKCVREDTLELHLEECPGSAGVQAYYTICH